MKYAFTPADIQKIIGISYRQIQHWDTSNFIRPSDKRRGKYRLYLFPDVVLMYVAQKLREAGYSIQGMREMLTTFRSLLTKNCRPLTELTILVTGDDFLVFDGTVLMNDSAKPYICISIRQLAEKIDAELSSGIKEGDRAVVL